MCPPSITPAAVRQKSGLGGSIQVGERHVSVERHLAATRRTVAAPAAAGGRGIRRLQLVQRGSLVQASVSERHRRRPPGEEDVTTPSVHSEKPPGPLRGFKPEAFFHLPAFKKT